MARTRNPLSNRNRNASFKGWEVQAAIEKLAQSKRARVVRQKGEFDLRDLESIIRPPFTEKGAHAWSLEQIVAARDQQMAGRFKLAAKLATSFNTDDALFTARQVRLAPVQSLSVKLEAARAAGRSEKIADEAVALFGSDGIAISSETTTTIRSHLTDHGIAFGAIDWMPRADGSRVDIALRAWPIEHVWWHEIAGCYVTPVRHLESEIDPTASTLFSPSSIAAGMPLEPIIHGDGRWVIFRKAELDAHRLDAAVLPGALVWARHAFSLRDWSKGSSAHGNAKVVGELPPETALTDAGGKLTQEAAAFLKLVQAVASHDAAVGIRPAGSKIDYTVNGSRAWEVWAKLAEVAERAAARIYLGTDGVLGAQGGAPGVDISELFGVATSKIQSDLRCIERGIQTGVISPWAAVNFGDDKLAPTRKYEFPDPDESRIREDFAKRNAAFNADVAQYLANGFVVDQALVDRLAELHGVPAPRLPTEPGAPATAPANDVAAARGRLVQRMPPMRRA